MTSIMEKNDFGCRAGSDREYYILSGIFLLWRGVFSNLKVANKVATHIKQYVRVLFYTLQFRKH
jgi:hypothetical protein